MQYRPNHILMNWLLALLMALAPLQAAVSAIDMLAHGKTRTAHCQTDMAGHMDQSDTGHADCCQHDGECADNCASCVHCLSVHAMLFAQVNLQHFTNHFFYTQGHSLAIGISDGSQYRPPRLFS